MYPKCQETDNTPSHLLAQSVPKRNKINIRHFRLPRDNRAVRKSLGGRPLVSVSLNWAISQIHNKGLTSKAFESYDFAYTTMHWR